MAVYDAMLTAVERARRGEGQTLVECKTIRWERHSAISGGKYEDEEDAKKWMKVDPIPRFEKVLEKEGISREKLDRLREEARAAANAALEFAMASSVPKADELEDFVYA